MADRGKVALEVSSLQCDLLYSNAIMPYMFESRRKQTVDKPVDDSSDESDGDNDDEIQINPGESADY